jgi:hypothetical protein
MVEEATDIAVLSSASNNPHFNTQQIEGHSEIFKTSGNCMGTVFKIMYSFVIGHSNNYRLITHFSRMLYVLIKLHL